MSRKLFGNCQTDIEKAEFIESGRAVDTGIMAFAMVDEIAKLYRDRITLSAEIERKDRALNWIHNKIVAKSELYNYDEDLLRDIRVITEQALSTKEDSDE